MREQGLVVGVFDQDLTTHLAQDASAGATTLYVTNVDYFSPLGGSLAIRAPGVEELEVTYEGIDLELIALTGVTPLVNSYTADDAVVSVYPYVTLRYAEVRIDGQNDTVRSRVPLALFDRIVPSVLSDSTGEGMRVEVELLGEYVVQDVIGTEPDYGATTFTVEENLRVEGILEITDEAVIEMDPGTSQVLQGQLADPTQSPNVTFDYEVVAARVDPVPSTDPYFTQCQYSSRRGMFYDVAGGFVYYVANQSNTLVIRKADVLGNVGTTVYEDTLRQHGSLTKVGSNWYVLSELKTDSHWYVQEFDSSWVATGTIWRVDTAFYDVGGRPIIGADPGGSHVWTWFMEGATSRAFGIKWTLAGADIENVRGSTAFMTSDWIRGAVVNGTYDYGDGVTRHALIYSDGLPMPHFLNTGGTNLNRPLDMTIDSPISTTCAGMMYGSDGNWYVMGNGITSSDLGTGVTSTYSVLYRLSKAFWPASETATTHVGYTWYDSDATGGTHETKLSPLQQVTAKRRKRINVTVPVPIPDAGGTDDADSARIYLARKSTAPTTSEMFLQSTLSPGVTTYSSMADYTESGTAAPTANNFPGSNAAVIYSQEDGTGLDAAGLGLGWSIEGDGKAHGFADVQVFTTPGSNTWNKPRTGGITGVEIIAIGGGGGGGGGRRSAAGTAAFGGGGGGGATVVIARFPISAFNDTETVVVGSGGTGGAGKATSNDGSAGTDGTNSTMTVGGSVKLTARNGGGGAGGSTTGPTAGGSTPGGSTFMALYGMPGGDGGTGSPTAPDNVPRVTTNWYRQGAGGGGGAGGVTAGGAASSSTAGSDCYDLTGGSGGVTGNGSAGSTKGAGLPFPGSGGGAGAGRVSGTAGNGGNGGLYGAGGGGGGGGQTVDSGSGGDGAQGIVVVRCY